MTTHKIYQAFYAGSMAQGFLHSHSYTGNPLACAAALASLRIFRDDDVLKHNQEKAQTLQNAFSWVQEDDRLVHFRQQGMILAFDLKGEVHVNLKHFASDLFKKALHHQLLLRPIGHTVYVMPPYILEEEQIHWMAKQLKKALNETLQSAH
jgi:adenosylmethionine-8-amino-7-oxononanoate aminotransferase